MAEQHRPIDLTTLAEVQRLLAATDFATVDDLARRADLIDLSDAIERVRATSATTAASAASTGTDGSVLTPLPRRR